MEEQGHPKENGMDFGAMLPMLMNLLQGSSCLLYTSFLPKEEQWLPVKGETAG